LNSGISGYVLNKENLLRAMDMDELYDACTDPYRHIDEVGEEKLPILKRRINGELFESLSSIPSSYKSKCSVETNHM
jgi:hypothetical protein